MELEQVTVTISPTGEVEILVQGVKGRRCLALTEELEAALGGALQVRTMTYEALEQTEREDLDTRQNHGLTL